jgi:hypothetical protein
MENFNEATGWMAKDTGWLWTIERPDEYTTVRVSDSRVWASDDEEKMNCGQYSRCAVRGNHNTIVIYHTAGATFDGLVVQEEFRCRNCGKYTQYRFDDRM